MTIKRDPYTFAQRTLMPADMHTVLNFLNLADECGVSPTKLYSRLQSDGLTACAASGLDGPATRASIVEYLRCRYEHNAAMANVAASQSESATNITRLSAQAKVLRDAMIDVAAGEDTKPAAP